MISSPQLPDFIHGSHAWWVSCARKLLEPLAAVMKPGAAELPISGIQSDHGAAADRLESFARPLALAAFYLSSKGTPDEAPFRERVADWFRSGLEIGCDPAHPAYWGPDASYHQHHVEMGLMAIALQVSADYLWDPLPEASKDRVCTWLATCRGGGIVNNNHLFMSVHILEFLRHQGRGHRTDAAVVRAHLNQLETMHRGGGWFEDGINQAFDHYNAYAFHFYGLFWARLHGERDPSRAARWREWARQFVDDYQHFYAASGEHPAFGRSITYRWNGIGIFGLAAAEGCSSVGLGTLRRLCSRSLAFFLGKPISQEQGALSVGFLDRFDQLAEPYTCAASPYWAAKGFTALLLPSTHEFWNSPELPLPAETGFVRPIAAAGLVVRSIPGGEVEILNGGSMVGNTQLRYGAWKWGKLSYRSGVHFTYAFPEATSWSPDGGLTQKLADGRVFGRHSTMTVEMDETHLGCSYNLGGKAGQVNTWVETFTFWRTGWLLHIHLIEPRQPADFTIGGFALPLSEPRALRSISSQYMAAWSTTTRGTALQILKGEGHADWDTRLESTEPRRHVAAPWHVTPLFRTGVFSSPRALVAIVWTGSDPLEAAAWTVSEGRMGSWKLDHPLLGRWDISHWSLPELS